MDGLFHKDIGFPNVKLPEGIYEIKRYSQHALRAAQDDRYGEARRLPTTIDMSQVDLVEIEVENNKVIKAVVRTHYDDKLDLIIVFMPEHYQNLVKTVWFNEKTDQHRTLQHWKYNTPTFN